ncbi:MAG: hypothetical protein JAY90_10675 [Candidatus Thiodiazotropha lotti]|nr:hypothetical protein [Candidatus Thiodiazotropha lotti]
MWIIVQKGSNHFSTLFSSLAQPDGLEFTDLIKEQLQLIALKYQALTDDPNTLKQMVNHKNKGQSPLLRLRQPAETDGQVLVSGGD